MSIYKDLKKVFMSGVDVLADKTSTQAQKSRLVTVMKNEVKIADQAYLALGKYLYTSMRNDLPEDVEQLCKVIDESKERMSRAQNIYRDVIRQEEVTSEIGKSELKENFRKVKEPIVTGAVTKAAKASVIVKDTAKDTAAKAEQLKKSAAEKAEDIKTKIRREKEEIEEKVEAIEEDIIEKIDSEAEQPVMDAENIETAVMEDTASVSESENEIESAAEEPAAPTVQDNAAEGDDESMPVPNDIISEEEFDENEPIVKPIEKHDPITKARKLKNIITKKNEE